MLIESILHRLMNNVLTFPVEEASGDLRPPNPGGGPCFLYVHIPFCERLCPYCSFHRLQFKAEKSAPYFAALRDEILHYRKLGYRFSEVYVGGGTPTVSIEQLGETLALIRDTWPVKKISVETNPDHLTDRVKRTLLDQRVNRLSVGVQSFDDQLLRSMDRYDKYGSGREIAARLKDTQGLFDTLNADMIFNLPLQRLESLERDIDVLRDVDIDQVSWYPLMVANAARRKMTKTMGIPDPDREETMYHLIRRALRKTHRPSTVWTFSRTDSMIDEYIVNQDEYVGVGSGSFSYLGGALYATSFSINRYQELVSQCGLGITRRRSWRRQWRLRYKLLMDLFGLWVDRHGNDYLGDLWRELTMLRMLGAVRPTPSGYALTERGMYLWVVLMREFFTNVNNFRDQMRAHIKKEYRRIPAAPIN